VPAPPASTRYGRAVPGSKSNRSGLRLVQGGASNSRPTDNRVSAGVDTLRLRFRGQEGAYEAHKGLGAAIHARGELRVTRGGVTVGAYPDGLVTVEGRLAAMLYGEEDHRLCGPADLERAPQAVADLLGISEGGEPAGVGRCDLASERVYADAREGRELLRAASYADVPWLKVGTEGGKRDEVQTVYWRTVRGRSVVLRLYDKGVETGQAAPGTWLRLERQRRYRKANEPTVGDVLARGLATSYAGRELASLVVSAGEVVVCSRAGAVAELRRLHAAGRVSGGQLHQLVAFVELGGEGLHVRTVYRRASLLRRLGIALSPESASLSRVQLGEAFADFASAWAA